MAEFSSTSAARRLRHGAKGWTPSGFADWALILGPLLLAFLLLTWFLPGWLEAGFGLDDRQLLFENPAIRDFLLHSIWMEAFWSFRGHEEMYRPLTAMSLALDHWLFGEDPLGYHRVNLALHLLACALISLGLMGPKNAWALVVFLVLYFHPASAEQAMWIAGRVGSLMLCFAGAAMLFARRGAWMASALFVVLAGLCRDDGILFLLLIPLCVGIPAHEARRPVLSQPWLHFLVAFLFWLSLRFLVLGSAAIPSDGPAARSVVERMGDLLASFGFQWEVLFLLERPRILQSTLPESGLASLVLPLFLGWLAFAWRKGWTRSLRAGIALLLAFLPFSGFFRLGEPVGGRYAYALLPWLLASGVLLPAMLRLRPLWLLPSALLLLPFWFREMQVLARAESTYERVLQYEPESRRARLNLALEWERLGQPKRALAELEELIRRHPRYAKPVVNRGRILYTLGQKQRGLAVLDRATQIFPKSSRAWLTYGRLLYKQKRYAEALAAMESCLSIRPREEQALLYLRKARSHLQR